jgi:hypothetical protein
LLATVFLITAKISRSACQSDAVEQVSDADPKGTKFGGRETSPTSNMVFKSWVFCFIWLKSQKKNREEKSWQKVA